MAAAEMRESIKKQRALAKAYRDGYQSGHLDNSIGSPPNAYAVRATGDYGEAYADGYRDGYAGRPKSNPFI
jgi:hypothetical protein